jgi:methylated-DNA-[protein]-cysteine S-methyltransferase
MTIPKTIQEAMRNYPNFYQKVWIACADIPKGEVRTYGELARQIGHPRAARAVGQALAANPFAPTIPCHRVIASNGALTGYSARGGIQRKRSMLLKEGVPMSLLQSASRN